jgi:GNAT superfamily N-acetyltransferase
LTVKDLSDPEITRRAREFYVEAKFPGVFNVEVFTRNWTYFIEHGIGAIFALVKDGVIVGALGAVILPDTTSGDLRASEMFWFVGKEHRGGGIALMDAFEKWGTERGAKQITMAYLKDSMPQIVESIYERRGYRFFEAHWLKEVNKPCQQ